MADRYSLTRGRYPQLSSRVYATTMAFQTDGCSRRWVRSATVGSSPLGRMHGHFGPHDVWEVIPCAPGWPRCAAVVLKELDSEKCRVHRRVWGFDTHLVPSHAVPLRVDPDAPGADDQYYTLEDRTDARTHSFHCSGG